MNAARRRGGRTSAWVSSVALVALGVGAVALAVLAVEHVRGSDEPGRTVAPVPTPSRTPLSPPASPAPSLSPAPSASPGPSTSPLPSADASADRMLTIGSGAWWRATAGSCGETAPIIERSIDSGATWSDVTPTYRVIGSVASLAAFAGTQAELVGEFGTACTLTGMRTFTQGKFWEPYTEVLAQYAHVTGTKITWGSRTLAAPCAEPRSIVSDTDTAALVCSGRAYVATDTPSTDWRQIGPSGALAIAIGDDEVAVISSAADAACAGLTLWAGSSTANATDASTSCVTGASAPAAVAFDTASKVTIWSGDRVTRVP